MLEIVKGELLKCRVLVFGYDWVWPQIDGRFQESCNRLPGAVCDSVCDLAFIIPLADQCGRVLGKKATWLWDLWS